MYTGKIDGLTFFIYILIGLLAMSLLKKAKLYEVKSKKNGNRYYILFILLLLIFAVFRKVDYKIGGMDALVYATQYESGVFEYTLEPLFGIIMHTLRFFSKNYHFFFAFVYLLILLAYVLFLKKYAKSNISFIPLVLLVFPFLKSFNTIRTSVAVALFQIGLTQIRKRKFVSLGLIICSILVHRTSSIFLPIWFFYFFFQKKGKTMKRSKLIFISSVLIISATLVAYILRDYVIVGNIFAGQGADMWYIKQSVGRSILTSFPMFIMHVLLLLALILFDKKVEKCEEYEDLRLFCLYDIAVMPAAVVLNFWRANEFNYIGRLIMWGYMFKIIERKFSKNNKIFIRILMLVICLIWLIFRIYSEWDDCKIMPYIFDLFNNI